MNLIMRGLGHYEPLETHTLIMIVSLIIRCIMRLLGFQCDNATTRKQQQLSVAICCNG